MKGGGSVASMQSGAATPRASIWPALGSCCKPSGRAAGSTTPLPTWSRSAAPAAMVILLCRRLIPPGRSTSSMTGGALGTRLVNAARFDSPGISIPHRGHRPESRGWIVGRARNAEDRPQQRAGPWRPDVPGHARAPGRRRSTACSRTPPRRTTRPAPSRHGRRGQQHSDSARGSTFFARCTGAVGGYQAVQGARATPAPSAAELPTRSCAPRATDPDAYDLDARTDGTVTADFSSFTTRRISRAGRLPRPGARTTCSATPGFMNSAAGDLTLRPDSPLIDRGDQALVLARRARRGRQPAVARRQRRLRARPDIGAFERPDTCPGTPPNTAPSVTRFSMTHSVFAPLGARAAAKRRKPPRGTKFRYTLSEAARVTITIRRRLRAGTGRGTAGSGGSAAQKQAGRQSTRFSGRLKRQGAPPRPLSRPDRRGGFARSPSSDAQPALPRSSGPSGRATPACASP